MGVKMCVNSLVVGLVIFVQCFSQNAAQDSHKIGAIFHEDSNYLNVAFIQSASLYGFETAIKSVTNHGSIMEIHQATCELASEGVIGVIDGVGGRASEHIQALCDNLELPHVVLQHNDLYSSNWTFVNLYPSPEAFNKVLTRLIITKGWDNFTILYTKGFSMNRVSTLMELGNDTDRYTVTIRELHGNDYRDVLINAKDSGYVNFVVDCPSQYLETLLSHAQQVGLMSDEHSYIFVSPDLFTVDLNRYRYGGANITGLRLVNPEKNKKLWNFTSLLNSDSNEEIMTERIKTKVLLVHDAVLVFYQASLSMVEDDKNAGKYTLKAESLSCDQESQWQHGASLINFMKTNKIDDGLTRELRFDGLGQRTDVIFDILELTPAGNQSIGTWKLNVLEIKRPFEPADIGEEAIMRNKTFKVLISETAPYGFVKESTQQMTGNDRYEGFTVDLIDKIADILGFYYEFEVENDYGSFLNDRWTGMIAKIREDRADFGICDFTITSEREKGIDFSLPFMSLGISILYKEPSKQPPAMFSFMAVFSQEVWLYMMFVQICVGVTMIFVSRISHKEWQNPVPCIEQPEELKNQFSFANSMWLIIGSVMQQGSEIAPIALGPRIITSVWWFFTMVMVASYVGTLVAFLTVEKNVMPFDSAEELSQLKSIAYGAKSKGSTISFFKDSSNPTYKAMYDKMVANKWLVEKNDKGVALTEKGGYAFFMESTSIEYETERHCDLMQVGGPLDSKSYGIGMKKGSKYKKYIDEALLRLREKGEIRKLKDLWWKEKRGGGKCGEKRDEEQKQLSMKNIQGAFVVLGVGCLIGMVISTLDMLWGVFKKSVKYGTTFKDELKEEMKFFIKFSGDIKPVKRPAKTDGSIEALAEAEGKDEVRSLKSVKSGTSTGTHKTHHSHSSKHSGLSVAFARRREYT